MRVVANVIRPGDTVLHFPSGEEWWVLRVADDHVHPAGYPPCRVPAAECSLIRRGTDAEHADAVAAATRGRGLR